VNVNPNDLSLGCGIVYSSVKRLLTAPFENSIAERVPQGRDSVSHSLRAIWHNAELGLQLAYPGSISWCRCFTATSATRATGTKRARELLPDTAKRGINGGTCGCRTLLQ
jgi:hypothetical protein